MAHQDEEKLNKEVIAEFERRRRVTTRMAMGLGAVAGTISLMAYYSVGSKWISVVLFVVSVSYGAFVHVKVWRCPACDGHLGKLYLGLKEPKYCPCCGIRLIEE